jgi:hypothetical protein
MLVYQRVNRGFHKWMAYDGKSQSKIDDEKWVPPF